MRYFLLYTLLLFAFSCSETKENRYKFIDFTPGKDTCIKVARKEKSEVVMLEDIEIIQNTVNDTVIICNGVVPPKQVFRFFRGHSKDYLFEYEICFKSQKATSGKISLKYKLKKL